MSKFGASAPGTLQGPRRKVATIAAAIGVLSLLVAMVAAAPGAGAAGKTTVILGGGGSLPDPACPDQPCRAIGSVTGFQSSTANAQLPFRVPRNGRIVSWSVTLAQPTNSQRAFFNGFFGTPPEARLAILKRIPKTSPPVYKLRRQSPIRVLSPYLGQTVKFRLGKPLAVRRGNIVGLTVPTWIPAFAVNQSARDTWRASRQKGKCFNTTALRQGRPQQIVDTKRVYGCRYSTARLLYTATLVED
ncbi:MAG: hypothetical protein U0R52_08385 [Solirubrobacterales bacterium]